MSWLRASVWFILFAACIGVSACSGSGRSPDVPPSADDAVTDTSWVDEDAGSGMDALVPEPRPEVVEEVGVADGVDVPPDEGHPTPEVAKEAVAEVAPDEGPGRDEVPEDAGAEDPAHPDLAPPQDVWLDPGEETGCGPVDFGPGPDFPAASDEGPGLEDTAIGDEVGIEPDLTFVDWIWPDLVSDEGDEEVQEGLEAVAKDVEPEEGEAIAADEVPEGGAFEDVVEAIEDEVGLEQDVATPDPCDPNPCLDPPPVACDPDGVTLVVFPAVGECVSPGGVVSCDYPPEYVDCSLQGKVCEDGACVFSEVNCPEDMVPVPLGEGRVVCMDRYEASRADATAGSPGTSPVATSRPGVMPWHVSQMSLQALQEFRAGCEAAGKRLCTKEEWFEACNGPDDTVYFFGNTWNPEICNCVDTFCDDHCAEHGISPCNTAENCGYQYYCFHWVPTGSFSNCTNAYGLYDVNGNVWEVVPVDTPRGYEVRGGAFNCGNPSQRLRCDFNANWDSLYAGFRCCKDPE